MAQAGEYRGMIRNSKWDKTPEFLTLSGKTHPLMTVRAFECEEWPLLTSIVDLMPDKKARRIIR